MGRWSVVINAALDHLRTQDATVVSTTSTSGYTGRCSYGTPNWNSREQRLEGGPAFIKHDVSGVSWSLIREAFGVTGWEGYNAAVLGVVIYERVDGIEIPADGVVVAQTWGKSDVEPHDERGFPHVTLTESTLEVGIFG